MRNARVALGAGVAVCLVAAASLGIGSCEAGRVGTYVCVACHDGRSAIDETGLFDGPHRDIACEDCHGPGYLHVRNGGRGGLFIENPAKLPFEESLAVCRSCHEDIEASFLQSEHAQKKVVSCHACHDVHKADGMERDFINNDLCLECHRFMGFGSDEAIEAHTVYHPNDPAGTGASRCTACHMVPLERFDQGEEAPHNHTLFTVPPIASNIAAELGVTPVPPNSCAGIIGCHDGTDREAPIFNVDDPEANIVAQSLYEAVGLVP